MDQTLSITYVFNFSFLYSYCKAQCLPQNIGVLAKATFTPRVNVFHSFHFGYFSDFLSQMPMASTLSTRESLSYGVELLFFIKFTGQRNEFTYLTTNNKRS